MLTRDRQDDYDDGFYQDEDDFDCCPYCGYYWDECICDEDYDNDYLND